MYLTGKRLTNQKQSNRKIKYKHVFKTGALQNTMKHKEFLSVNAN